MQCDEKVFVDVLGAEIYFPVGAPGQFFALFRVVLRGFYTVSTLTKPRLFLLYASATKWLSWPQTFLIPKHSPIPFMRGQSRRIFLQMDCS